MSEQPLARNRKAYHNYAILEEYEAGMVLLGTEVKAIRDHGVSLKDSYARFKKNELWLENCHISPYSHASLDNHDPRRPRKLLLHRRQINKLIGKVVQKGLTLVPLALYLKGGKVKVRLAVARGKRSYDKRESKRRKVVEREVRAELKRRQR
ncbi:MAG: SsrA-binding protein SmpB [Acidobacteriota bacterium]